MVKHVTELLRDKGELSGSDIKQGIGYSELSEYSLILNRLREDIAELKNEPNAPIHFYRNPHRLINSLEIAGLPPKGFPVAEIPTLNAMPFITDDEVDLHLTGGSHFSEGKFRILSYYLHNHTPKERADFIKHEYGHGGGTWGDKGWYDAEPGKGIEFKRGDIFKPSDTVSLSWSKAAQRIGELIHSGRYMTRIELNRIPEYEEIMLARNIKNFFYNLPDEYERPFAEKMDFHYPHEEEWAALRAFLGDTGRIDATLAVMQRIFVNTPEEDRFYNLRKTGFENLSNYREGTYTLFPNLDRLPDPELAVRRSAPATRVRQSAPEIPPPPASVEQLSLFGDSTPVIFVDTPLPILPSVEEQRTKIEQSNELTAEATAPAVSLPITQDEIDALLLGAVETTEQFDSIIAQFAKNPRSRDAVQIVRDTYSDGVYLMHRLDGAEGYMGLMGDSAGLTLSKGEPRTTPLAERKPSVSLDLAWAKVHRHVAELVESGRFQEAREQPPVFHSPQRFIPYREGDTVDALSINNAHIKLVIDQIDDRYVYYTMPDDVPEQEPVEMFRSRFEGYLDDGRYKIMEPGAKLPAQTIAEPETAEPVRIAELAEDGRYEVYELPYRAGGYAVWDNERHAFYENEHGNIDTFHDKAKADAYRDSLYTTPDGKNNEPSVDANVKPVELDADTGAKTTLAELEITPVPPISYNIGDRLTYNGKPHEIDWISDYVKLRNLGTPAAYPIFDYISILKNNFESMLADGEIAIEQPVTPESAPELDFDTVAKTALTRVILDKDYIAALGSASSRASLRNPCTWALEQSIRDHEQDEPEVYRKYFSKSNFKDRLFDFVLRQSWANRQTPEAVAVVTPVNDAITEPQTAIPISVEGKPVHEQAAPEAQTAQTEKTIEAVSIESEKQTATAAERKPTSRDLGGGFVLLQTQHNAYSPEEIEVGIAKVDPLLRAAITDNTFFDKEAKLKMADFLAGGTLKHTSPDYLRSLTNYNRANNVIALTDGKKAAYGVDNRGVFVTANPDLVRSDFYLRQSATLPGVKLFTWEQAFNAVFTLCEYQLDGFTLSKEALHKLTQEQGKATESQISTPEVAIEEHPANSAAIEPPTATPISAEIPSETETPAQTIPVSPNSPPPVFFVNWKNAQSDFDLNLYNDGDIIGYDKDGVKFELSRSGKHNYVTSTGLFWGGNTVPGNIYEQINAYKNGDLTDEQVRENYMSVLEAFKNFRAADLEKTDDDLVDVLSNGLFTREGKKNILWRLENNATNYELAVHLSDFFHIAPETMTLTTGETAVYSSTPSGVFIDIDDNSNTNLSFSWADIAPILRALEPQWLAMRDAERAANATAEQAVPQPAGDEPKEGYMTAYGSRQKRFCGGCPLFEREVTMDGDNVDEIAS